jgi:acetyl-CoA acetyltransferase
VHKYQFMKSETFVDMFAVESHSDAESAVAEGSSDNPIKLKGVLVAEFEGLLTVLYAQ